MNEELEYFKNDELALTIWNNKYRNNNESFNDWLDRISNKDINIKQLIKDKKFIFGGRTLSNRGIKDGSYSNCYSIGYVKDTLTDILDTNTKIALTYKAQGGQGLSLSKLRPKDTLIKEFYKSDGIIPFMRLFNQTTDTITQGGSRKGALLISLDIWHKEAASFITIKSNNNEINKANLSVEIDDEFMSLVDKCYKTNNNIIKHIKKAYSGHIIEYDVDVLKLYKLLCYNAWKNAEPGVIYTDKFRNYNIMQYVKQYNIETCNPCQPAWATILTPDGIKTFKDINIGDTIWSSTGWTKIINKASSGINDVYKYTTPSGVFNGTINHNIISKNKKIEVDKATTIDTLAGDTTKYSIMYNADIMAGLLISKGIINPNTGNIVLDIEESDVSEYFKSDIKSSIIQSVATKGICYLEINTIFNEDNIKTDNEKCIPTKYLYKSDAHTCSILRGIYSALSNIVDNMIILKTYSSVFKDQIQLMLSSVGIKSWYTENTLDKSFTINISTTKQVFLTKIGFIQSYKTELLNNNLEDLENKSSTTILNKEFINKEEVFNITVDNTSHTYWTGGLNVSNCGEQPLPKHGACNLCSINLSEYVINPYTDKACLDYTNLQTDIVYIVQAMDEVLTENLDRHALIEQKYMAENYRNIGIGIMGLADTFVKLGYTYGDEDSIKFSSQIMYTIFRNAVIASIELAENKGSFPKYSPEVWDSDIMKFAFSKDELSVFKKNNKLRNCSLLSIAPTGSIGTMFNVSTGVEPFFQLKYTRKTETLNNKDTYYDVDVKAVSDYKSITGNNTLPSYFVSSSDINWKNRIAIQGALQMFVDTAISSTINLPKETTQETIEQLYLEGWKKGLKGLTIYVEGSRTPILSKINPNIDKIISYKRPKELEADFYRIKVKGENFIVLVGLLDNKPYEIFTFRPDFNDRLNVLIEHKGKIIKESKRHYSFKSQYTTIKDLQAANINIEENAATLYSSMLLRHNINIKYIIKTAKKVNENITSFSSAMCRILAKYVPTETVKGEVCPECGSSLINEGGCIHCSNCYYSKCN